MKNKNIILGAIAIIVVVVIIFVFSGDSEETSIEVTSEPAGNWVNFELRDVATGETFKISDFSDKPVLLESFAVWCPTCTRQQKEIRKLHEEIGDSVISISIDTDPNEDKGKVLEHIERNSFNWFYAVSPVEFTRSLIDQFGINIVNAPSAPMILICNGEHARQLDSGIKSVGELKEELARGC